MLNQIDKENKDKKFKENAAKQREKIRTMKNDDSPTRAEFVQAEKAPSVAKLTEANLKKVEAESQKAS